jgi:hypothetical protein
LYSEHKIFRETPSKRNRVLESDNEKEERARERERETDRQTDRQWTDKRQSQPCAPPMHRITGVEGCFNLKPPHGEEQPIPPAGSKSKTAITDLKLAKKYSVLCVPQKTNQENI